MSGSHPRSIGRPWWPALLLLGLLWLACAPARAFTVGSTVFRDLPCAPEGGTCAFVGIGPIAFGAAGKFVVATASASKDCNSSAFGSDPALGVAKACYLANALSPAVAPSVQPGTVVADGNALQIGGESYNAIPCAIEWQNCSFNGTYKVAFGANGNYVTAWVTGPRACTTSTFGLDPAPGVAKVCHLSSAGTALNPPATLLIQGVPFIAAPCAGQWARCNYFGSRHVAYGAAGKFYLTRANAGPKDCNANAIGFDPDSTLSKACYISAATVAAGTFPPLNPAFSPDPLPIPDEQKQAARLLHQATYGANLAEIQRVAAMPPEAWVDEQLALPLNTPSHWDYVATGGPLGTSKFINAVMESFWSQAATGPDQLRQRMVLALSEIFVVSTVNSSVSTQPDAHAAYLDMLARNAFGNYRNLLEGVARSPAMGLYLSHLRNQKEDATGRLPDENFAREVMQLFSIGLWQLNPDGSRQLDAQGRPIPSYTQADVMGMAKVFTGWSWGGSDSSVNRWYGWSGSPWNEPMQNFASFHSTSEKRIVGGVVIPAGTDGPTSLKIALDTLANHPNVAPFMSEQLIKRFVTSNPSRDYVGRVAAVWADNGQGVRGDLAAVLRAILLDAEARSDAQLADLHWGKLREPMVRFGHWIRAFNAKPNNSVWGVWNLEDPVSSLGQNPQREPSVFSFFRPDYAPPGLVLDAGLVAPEFQITHETTLTGYANFMSWTAERGYASAILPDYSAHMVLADNPRALVERLNLELLAGRLSDATRARIIDAVDATTLISPNARLIRTWNAIYLIMNSPEYVVQR
ncbi:MAG: hypothetical protein RJA44_592 [Pseudomonadota bacterium]